jgi:hypothetical protein
VPLLVLPTAVLPGCQMNERTTGTLAGVAGGALLGAAISGSAGAILLGAAGGGLLGYVIGDYLTDCRCGGGGNSCGSCGVPPPCGSCMVPTSPCAVPQASSLRAAPRAATPASDAARRAYERGRAAATAEQARAGYEESARLDPARPEPWNALGVLALAQGDQAAARSHWERALAVDAGYAPARQNLTRLADGR